MAVADGRDTPAECAVWWVCLNVMVYCAAGGCQPYCVLTVDDPAQSYVTSPVTNSVNPFFDEQFIL